MVRRFNPDLKGQELVIEWGPQRRFLRLAIYDLDRPNPGDRTPLIDGLVLPDPAAGGMRLVEFNIASNGLFVGRWSVLPSGDVVRQYELSFADGQKGTFRELWRWIAGERDAFAWHTETYREGAFVPGDIVVEWRKSTGESGEVPPAAADTSWREHFAFLSAGGGFWLTLNDAYRTEENREPVVYGMRYWPGFGGTTLHGCLWGAQAGPYPGHDPVIFWRFFTAWDPSRKALLVQQSGANGVIGIGYEVPGTGVAEQTFTAPDGTRWEVRHLSSQISPDSLVTRSLQRTTGDWEPRRTYTWIRQRPGGAPCGGDGVP